MTRMTDALREVFGDAATAVVPVHPRLPRRAGAVLHVVGHRPAGLGDLDVGGDQGAPSNASWSTPAARSPTTTPSGACTARSYDRQRPELFADALRAAKQTVDPDGILNPGVLIDP